MRWVAASAGNVTNMSEPNEAKERMKQTMKSMIAVAALAAVMVSLAGCQTTTSQKRSKVVQILTQPEHEVVQKGKTAVFKIKAQPLPLEYQWYFNGAAITGATERVLIIPQADTQHVGFYSCRVSKGDACQTSDGASLTLYSRSLTLPARYSVSVPGTLTAKTGTGGACPGPYKGFVTFKDYSQSTPSIWFKVPVILPAATQCTAADQSPYTTKVEVKKYGLAAPWCDTETKTLPVVANGKYQFTTYFSTINPPSSTETIVLDIVWY